MVPIPDSQFTPTPESHPDSGSSYKWEWDSGEIFILLYIAAKLLGCRLAGEAVGGIFHLNHTYMGSFLGWIGHHFIHFIELEFLFTSMLMDCAPDLRVSLYVSCLWQMAPYIFLLLYLSNQIPQKWHGWPISKQAQQISYKDITNTADLWLWNALKGLQ